MSGPQHQAASATRMWSWAALMVALSFAMIGIAASVGCGTAGPNKRSKPAELVVTSFSPQERTDDARAPIRLQFSNPAVLPEAVGKALSSPPVIVFPPLRFASHWADRQTLVLQPLQPLSSSTRYTVQLAGALSQRSKQQQFSFVHRPLRVRELTGIDPSATSTRPTLSLRFNQPVVPNAALRHCALRRKGQQRVTALVSASADLHRPINDIVLSPREPLAQGARYELRCEQLAGAGGNATLEAPYVTEFFTYPELRVVSRGPSGNDVSANEVRVRVTFSTPVRLDQIRQQLQIRPRARGFSRGWLDRTGTVYTTEVNLRVSTRYTVKLAAAFNDAYGQRLEKPLRFSFKTGDASPQLSLEKGIYALEASAAGYPVWSRNVTRFGVSCAFVPKERIVKLLTTTMDYDPWYDAQYGKGQQVSWKKVGLRPRRSVVTTDRKRNKWQLHHLQLNQLCSKQPHAKQGLYLAEIRSRQVERGLAKRIEDNHYFQYRYPFRVLANVTDLGVLVKAGTASGLVWVSSIASGDPVSGAKVTIYTPQGRRVFSGRSNSDGIVHLPGTTKLLQRGDANTLDFDSYRAQRLIAIVEKGADLAAVDGNWQNGINTWNYGVPVDRRAGTTRIRGFIQSDRGIYRPGEKVHFKGLVREVAVGRSPRVPEQKRIAITVTDPRNNTVYRRRLHLTPFGGFSFDLPLSEHCTLGDYHVTAEVRQLGDKRGRHTQTFRERFMVEAFRKVTYELKLGRHARHTRLGRSYKLSLDARYLFGAPVAEARVRWQVQRRTHMLRFPKLAQYLFRDYGAEDWRSWYAHWRSTDNALFVSDGQGHTDDKGRFSLSFLDPNRKLDEPQDYLVSATVTDETDQSVTKRAVITAHKRSFYLGIHPQEWVQAAQMPFAVNTVAVAPDGKRVAANATLEWVRKQDRCRYVTDGSSRALYKCIHKRSKVWSRKISIPATGSSTHRIVPREAGQYVVRVKGKDRYGNRVAASIYIWVIGKGQAFWSGDESARMSLIPSKSLYRIGETARLVPRAAMSKATALVTLERNGILDARVLRLDSTSQGITIPIEAAHAPNIFASVALVSGRSGPGDQHRPRFKMGVTELKVSPETARLKVSVSLDREKVEPGQPVRGTIRVLDAAGQPVEAEVSLSAADEGVLQLIAYETPDPMKTFYKAWGLGIDSSTNYNRIARLNDPHSLQNDEEGGDGGGTGVGPKVRSRFVSSAYWAPALLTNARGEVSFSFRAPDNLTAFRLMAVAADRGSRFGSGDSRLTVSKPLLAKPVLPRFLAAGDRADVGVIVHNYSGQDGLVTVTARAHGVRLARRTRRIRLGDGTSARVRFAAEALVGQASHSVRKASFVFTARMGKHVDALKISLPIQRPMNIERKLIGSGVLDSETSTVALPIDWSNVQGLLAADSRLEVTIDRTGLSDLKESLRYLIAYPYGCIEQTLSRFIPLTKVEELARSLGMAQLRGPRLRRFLRAGVDKVQRRQHANGHFSYWPAGATYPHLTAYALFGLAEARLAKVDVDEAVIKRGVKALHGWANGSGRSFGPGGEIATLAQAAYVLARLGQPDAALAARLFEARAALPIYGKAFLARAMKIGGAPAEQQQTLLKELIAAPRVAGEVATVKERRMGSPFFTMGTDVQSAAIVLSALLELDPKNPLCDKLALGLKQAQQPSGRWYNTQDTVYSLVALTDWARRIGRGRSTAVTLRFGGHELSRRLRTDNVLSWQRPLQGSRPGELTLSARGRAAYSVRLVLASKAEQGAARSNGFVIKREYVDARTGKPITSASAGQLVKVRVMVSSNATRHFVAVVDPLPAGLEAVNQKLATSVQTADYAREQRRRSWWWYRSGWTHQEVLDDQVRAFADRFAGSQRTLEYLARATITGRFTAAPARIEAMYQPDTNAHTSSATFEVVR